MPILSRSLLTPAQDLYADVLKCNDLPRHGILLWPATNVAGLGKLDERVPDAVLHPVSISAIF